MTVDKLTLAVLSFVAVASSEQFPRFEMKSLSNHEVILPAAVRGQVAVLITGFTNASSAATKAWTTAAEKDFSTDPRYMVLQAAILEDVPRLIRGMVVGSIRNGTPPAKQDRFLTTFQSEKAWKQLVGFSAPDDAYVILLDGKSEIRWQGHGRFTEGEYAKFREQAGRVADEGGSLVPHE
jgi:hypothetical protein